MKRPSSLDRTVIAPGAMNGTLAAEYALAAQASGFGSLHKALAAHAPRGKVVEMLAASV